MPPATITRGSMRTRIRLRMGDTTTTPFYSTTLLNDVIDSRCLARASEISRLAPNFYLAHASYTGADDATDSTYEFYNFPSNFGTFVKLERQFGTGQNTVFQTMRKVNPEDQDRYRIGFNLVLLLPDSMQNFQQTVADWGSQFRLIPPPVNNSYLYRLRYLRQPIASSADESVLDIPREWEEVIALDSAIFCFMTAGDQTNAQGLTGLLSAEIASVHRTYRRHNMSVEGIGTLDQMT